MTKNGVLIVGQFVDDFGNDVVPSQLSYLSYSSRYYFYSN